MNEAGKECRPPFYLTSWLGASVRVNTRDGDRDSWVAAGAIRASSRERYERVSLNLLIERA